MSLIKCAAYIAATGILSFLIGTALPRKWFYADQFLFRCRAFEKDGRFYEKIYIHKWKTRVPDMSRIFPWLVPPKRFSDDLGEKLPLMIQETCVAEAVHLALCLTGLYCIKLWPGVGGVIISALNALGNMLFVWIQRYNRPRFIKIMTRYADRYSSRASEYECTFGC